MKESKSVNREKKEMKERKKLYNIKGWRLRRISRDLELNRQTMAENKYKNKDRSKMSKKSKKNYQWLKEREEKGEKQTNEK